MEAVGCNTSADAAARVMARLEHDDDFTVSVWFDDGFSAAVFRRESGGIAAMGRRLRRAGAHVGVEAATAYLTQGPDGTLALAADPENPEPDDTAVPSGMRLGEAPVWYTAPPTCGRSVRPRFAVDAAAAMTLEIDFQWGGGGAAPPRRVRAAGAFLVLTTVLGFELWTTKRHVRFADVATGEDVSSSFCVCDAFPARDSEEPAQLSRRREAPAFTVHTDGAYLSPSGLWMYYADTGRSVLERTLSGDGKSAAKKGMGGERECAGGRVAETRRVEVAAVRRVHGLLEVVEEVRSGAAETAGGAYAVGSLGARADVAVRVFGADAATATATDEAGESWTALFGTTGVMTENDQVELRPNEPFWFPDGFAGVEFTRLPPAAAAPVPAPAAAVPTPAAPGRRVVAAVPAKRVAAAAAVPDDDDETDDDAASAPAPAAKRTPLVARKALAASEGAAQLARPRAPLEGIAARMAELEAEMASARAELARAARRGGGGGAAAAGVAAWTPMGFRPTMHERGAVLGAAPAETAAAYRRRLAAVAEQMSAHARATGGAVVAVPVYLATAAGGETFGTLVRRRGDAFVLCPANTEDEPLEWACADDMVAAATAFGILPAPKDRDGRVGARCEYNGPTPFVDDQDDSAFRVGRAGLKAWAPVSWAYADADAEAAMTALYDMDPEELAAARVYLDVSAHTITSRSTAPEEGARRLCGTFTNLRLERGGGVAFSTVPPSAVPAAERARTHAAWRHHATITGRFHGTRPRDLVVKGDPAHVRRPALEMCAVLCGEISMGADGGGPSAQRRAFRKIVDAHDRGIKADAASGRHEHDRSDVHHVDNVRSKAGGAVNEGAAVVLVLHSARVLSPAEAPPAVAKRTQRAFELHCEIARERSEAAAAAGPLRDEEEEEEAAVPAAAAPASLSAADVARVAAAVTAAIRDAKRARVHS